MDYRREHDRLTRLAEKRANRRSARQMVDDLWNTPIRGLPVDWVAMMSFKEDRTMSDRTKCVLWSVGCFLAGGLAAALSNLMGG